LLIGVALLPAPCVSLIVGAMGQGQSPERARTPPPRPGKPEGTLPDLEDVKNESSLEREPPRRFLRRFVHRETPVSRGTAGVLVIRNQHEASYMRMRDDE
jgi:hypothetical protein